MSVDKELVEVDNSEGSYDNDLEDLPEYEEIDVGTVAPMQTSQGVGEPSSSTLEERVAWLEGEMPPNEAQYIAWRRGRSIAQTWLLKAIRRAASSHVPKQHPGKTVEPPSHQPSEESSEHQKFNEKCAEEIATAVFENKEVSHKCCIKRRLIRKHKSKDLTFKSLNDLNRR
ncbi:hypothetical protein RND71_019686 [Anisodus tanguticus]|uniref:Uncharacterized protein n=1 Tax=Anisodus tanguticus TaxID=243964 RepID=A0AAE1RXU1_9SOLA|nr:hypothetical protein RND71_019686 [Anisodus tanguticus]